MKKIAKAQLRDYFILTARIWLALILWALYSVYDKDSVLYTINFFDSMAL
ncbi:hypothetical protein SAMN03003324_03957 [Pedobacter antarcticus]|uniref:Uncharacterized protein n=1 Tax=Pedobacter antarcticus TaxID=34086 RepID=A0A1I2IUF9_9SPHI|nr:hypothetical protein SAMN03003324_03957 [Pedobacter antarcticus]